MYMAKKKKRGGGKKKPQRPSKKPSIGKAGPGNPWPARLKALRAMRKAKTGQEYTQVMAAKDADVSASTWIAWENNRRAPSKAMQIVLLTIFEELKEL